MYIQIRTKKIILKKPRLTLKGNDIRYDNSNERGMYVLGEVMDRCTYQISNCTRTAKNCHLLNKSFLDMKPSKRKTSKITFQTCGNEKKNQNNVTRKESYRRKRNELVNPLASKCYIQQLAPAGGTSLPHLPVSTFTSPRQTPFMFG